MNFLLRVVDPFERPLRRGRRNGWRGGRDDGWRRAVWQAQLRHHPRNPQPRAHAPFDRRRLAAVEYCTAANHLVGLLGDLHESFQIVDRVHREQDLAQHEAYMSSVAQRPPRGPHHFVANGTITYEVFPEELVEVI